jgi:hypothetical protein
MAKGASGMMWSTQLSTDYHLTRNAGRGVWVTEDGSVFDGARFSEYARGGNAA